MKTYNLKALDSGSALVTNYIQFSVHKLYYDLFDGEFANMKVGNSIEGKDDSNNEKDDGLFTKVFSYIRRLKNGVMDVFDVATVTFEKLTSAILTKSLVNASSTPSAVFVFPYPVSFSENFNQKYVQNEMNVSKAKIETTQDVVSSAVSCLPVVGSTTGMAIDAGFDAIIKMTEEYAERSSAFLDPNIMNVFSGPDLRRVEFNFHFAFDSQKERDTVIEGLKALKKYSLSSMKKLMQGSWMQLNYLRMEHAFSFKIIDLNGNDVILNNLFNCSMESKVEDRTEPFFLENINIKFASVNSYGLFHDGTPKFLNVSLSFVEVKSTYNTIWKKFYEEYTNKGKLKNINLSDYVNVLNLAEDCCLDMKIYAPNVSESVINKLKNIFNQTEGTTNKINDNLMKVAEEIGMTSEKKWELFDKTLNKKGALSLFVSQDKLDSIRNSDFIKGADELTASVGALPDILWEGVTSIPKLFSVSDEQSASLKTIEQVGTFNFNIIWPLPAELPNEQLSHNFDSSIVNQIDRIQNAALMGSKILGAATKSASVNAGRAAQVRSGTGIGNFMDKFGEFIKKGSERVKELAISKSARAGFTFNPLEMSAYKGTNIRSYNLQYNVYFQSNAHFQEVIKTLILLKYFMSSTPSNGIKGEPIFLTRPCYFTLRFYNNAIDDIYGLANVPLNLTSLNINYDNTYQTHDGNPKKLDISMTFSEIAPRRNIDNDNRKESNGATKSK